MRSICFFVGDLTFKSGIVKVVFNIARELNRDDQYNVSIMCIHSSSESRKKVEETLCVFDLDLHDHKEKTKYLSVIGKIRKDHLLKKIDVLIISGMEWCVPIYMSCGSLKRSKLIAWEHLNFLAGPKYRLEWFGKRLACKKFSGILSITKRDHDHYRQYKKRGYSSKLFQIYNLSDFISQEYPYSEESHKIVSCGYLAPIKGFDMLIKVASRVFLEHTDWTWDIYGEGDERADLEHMIREYKMENHVFLKGYQTDMYELYKKYSFFVLTSRAEGMGMVLLEAQKAGLPIVSFDIDCGPSDLIENDINGYLIKPFDLEEMEEKINKLIDSKSLRKRFSDASKKNHNEFEKDHIVKKWKEMLDHIVNDKTEC